MVQYTVARPFGTGLRYFAAGATPQDSDIDPPAHVAAADYIADRIDRGFLVPAPAPANTVNPVPGAPAAPVAPAVSAPTVGQALSAAKTDLTALEHALAASTPAV